MRQRSDLFLLLALCPPLAVSDTVVNGIGLGAAMIITTLLASGVLAVLSRWIGEELRLATILLVMAGSVAAIELLMRAWFHAVWESLDVFVALIVSNMALVHLLHERCESKLRMIADALKLSLTVAATLIVLGVARELVGRGSLLHGAGAAFGAWAAQFELNVFRVDMGFLLGMLPPGAFIALGLLIAVRNWLVRSKPLHE
jgi:electron transport complex protein RnfE